MEHAALAVIPQGVQARLSTAFESLSEAEQRVASFIEQQPSEIVNLSVKRLADRIGVSEATVVRCCQSLGYRGLRELKLALAAERAIPLQLLHEQVRPDDSVLTIAQTVLNFDIQALANMLAVLDGQALELAVQALATAPRIEFYGIGSSTPVVFDAYFRFLRIGLPASAVTDPYVQLISASQLPPGGVAFGISHSGRSAETINALKAAQLAGATCIALTSHANTPLGQCAHIELITADRATVFQSETVASRIGQLSLLDILCVALTLRRPAG